MYSSLQSVCISWLSVNDSSSVSQGTHFCCNFGPHSEIICFRSYIGIICFIRILQHTLWKEAICGSGAFCCDTVIEFGFTCRVFWFTSGILLLTVQTDLLGPENSSLYSNAWADLQRRLLAKTSEWKQSAYWQTQHTKYRNGAGEFIITYIFLSLVYLHFRND